VLQKFAFGIAKIFPHDGLNSLDERRGFPEMDITEASIRSAILRHDQIRICPGNKLTEKKSEIT
jgi:hypothetical protein